MGPRGSLALVKIVTTVSVSRLEAFVVIETVRTHGVRRGPLDPTYWRSHGVRRGPLV